MLVENRDLVINSQVVKFEVMNGETYITSLDIASVFEKRHDNIIAQIRAFPKDEFHALNFKETERTAKFGAVVRSEPYYKITEKGFNMLAMSFTGERFYKFKVEFIEHFEKLNLALKVSVDKYNELLSYAKKLKDKNSSRPHLDNLIKSVGKLNEKLSDLDSKNRALTSELITTKDKYTTLLEKQIILLEQSKIDKPSNESKKGTHLSYDEINKINELYAKGYAKYRIAKIVGRSENAVYRAIKRANLF